MLSGHARRTQGLGEKTTWPRSMAQRRVTCAALTQFVADGDEGKSVMAPACQGDHASNHAESVRGRSRLVEMGASTWRAWGWHGSDGRTADGRS